MEEELFYKLAMKEMNNLAEDVLNECIEFADSHDYDKEWVVDRFQEQFQKVKAKKLKNWGR